MPGGRINRPAQRKGATFRRPDPDLNRCVTNHLSFCFMFQKLQDWVDLQKTCVSKKCSFLLPFSVSYMMDFVSNPVLYLLLEALENNETDFGWNVKPHIGLNLPLSHPLAPSFHCFSHWPVCNKHITNHLSSCFVFQEQRTASTWAAENFCENKMFFSWSFSVSKITVCNTNN